MGFLRLRRFDRDVGVVLAAYAVLLAFENVAVGFGWRAFFVGSWEMGSARVHVSPIALALAIPTAMAAVLVARLARGGRRGAVAFLAMLAGGGLAFGVSTGRRLASLAVRLPFCVAVALAAGALGWLLAWLLPRARPALVVVLGAYVAVGAWLADAFALPRLYPVFHLGLFFVALFAWSSWAVVVRSQVVAWVGLLLASASLAWTPIAARKLGGQDNLRRVLLEHAPMLGRAVKVASQLAPPPPLEEDAAANATLAGLKAPQKARALDFKGKDIVVITIDALRADHVSSYGYGRPTTPNIDALAARGVRFAHAYCPTPHTSYSIASMMTGKYMKPLLALAPDDASETWPVQLQRYGYRTAAFYPPAVFFIDEHRFKRLKDEHLGFEYAKEEFAGPALRASQVEQYLGLAPKDKPLFLWVHVFEPHEPYEMHPEHPFEGEPRVDAYDSEVAEADALVGKLVALFEAKRPGAVVVVSADHGEEHGEHGGYYHGTTVYEEQVRVPLVVVGPGIAPRVVDEPVQTIDLLPTTLAALEVPIPPRLRGRDLGPAIAGGATDHEGLAFAETDDYTLTARGDDRLVCARKIGSCSLFDVARDPGQLSAVTDRTERVTELRKLTAAIQRETGKLESSLPEALRRGLQGDRDAAEDVAPLLDDAKVDIRRAAARCGFRLKAPDMAPALKRAAERDEDAEVKRWASLALVRLGEEPESVAAAALASTEPAERLAAAVALGERGDPRGQGELLARWTAQFGSGSGSGSGSGELAEARELLGAFGKTRAKAAVPVLLKALPDVRLRPYVVEALADIGDPRAKMPILKQFAEEPYKNLRPLEARALLKLGARYELLQPLARFAGAPEPMLDALQIAHDARILTPDKGGRVWPQEGSKKPDNFDLKWARTGPARILVLVENSTALNGTLNGVPLPELVPYAGNLYVLELAELAAGRPRITLATNGTVTAVWAVPRVADVAPPAPKPTDPEGKGPDGL